MPLSSHASWKSLATYFAPSYVQIFSPTSLISSKLGAQISSHAPRRCLEARIFGKMTADLITVIQERPLPHRILRSAILPHRRRSRPNLRQHLRVPYQDPRLGRSSRTRSEPEVGLTAPESGVVDLHHHRCIQHHPAGCGSGDDWRRRVEGEGSNDG